MKIEKFYLPFTRHGVLTFAFTLAAGFAFTACSDDEDGDGGGGSAGGSSEAGVVTGSDGEKLYLKSAGDWNFSYDESGKLTSARDGLYSGADIYAFTYNPFTITNEYSGSDGTMTDTYSGISLNKSGYVTKMKETVIDEYYGETETTVTNASCSYDGAGHLTKISVSGKVSGTEDGEKYSYNASASYVFTWSGGKLTKVKWTSNVGGEKETETTVFDYDEERYPNKTKQYTGFIDDVTEDIDFAFLLGYMGKGPDYHPTACELTSEYEGEEDVDSYNYSYVLNSNGSVNRVGASFNGGRTSWSDYTYYNASDFGSDDASYAPFKAQRQDAKPRMSIAKKFAQKVREMRKRDRK